MMFNQTGKVRNVFLIFQVIIFCVSLFALQACNQEGTRKAQDKQTDSKKKIDDGANPFEPGSLVDESIQSFPDTGIMNQHGEPVSVETLPDKPTVMSFIYTRCPMSEMCPLVAYKMAKIQDKLQDRNGLEAHLVLVTFDPEYDKPDVLKSYAKQRDINFRNFDLWTGPPKVINQFVKKFKIIKKEDHSHSDSDTIPKYTLTHNLRTYIIDKNNVVRYWYRGSDWKPKHIIQRIGVL